MFQIPPGRCARSGISGRRLRMCVKVLRQPIKPMRDAVRHFGIQVVADQQRALQRREGVRDFPSPIDPARRGTNGEGFVTIRSRSPVAPARLGLGGEPQHCPLRATPWRQACEEGRRRLGRASGHAHRRDQRSGCDDEITKDVPVLWSRAIVVPNAGPALDAQEKARKRLEANIEMRCLRDPAGANAASATVVINAPIEVKSYQKTMAVPARRLDRPRMRSVNFSRPSRRWCQERCNK